jgi:hypothetical protein
MARRAGRPIVPRCRPRRRSCISLSPRADGSPRPNTTPTQRYAVPRAEHQRRIKTRHRFREARGIGSAGLKGYQSGGRIPTYGGSKQIAWVPHSFAAFAKGGIPYRSPHFFQFRIGRDHASTFKTSVRARLQPCRKSAERNPSLRRRPARSAAEREQPTCKLCLGSLRQLEAIGSLLRLVGFLFRRQFRGGWPTRSRSFFNSQHRGCPILRGFCERWGSTLLTSPDSGKS